MRRVSGAIFAVRRQIKGVCICEILTHGERPWSATPNVEVLARVERGERIPQPDGCPAAVYALLCEMWSLEASRRPTMLNVCTQLDALVAVATQTEPRRLVNKSIDIGVDALAANLEHLDSTLIERTIAEQRAKSSDDERWLEEVRLSDCCAQRC